MPGRQRFFRFQPPTQPGLQELVISESNRLAHELLLRLLREGRIEMNPLVLHGAPGTGKSRLLQSFRRSVRDGSPEREVPILDGRTIQDALADVPAERISLVLEERLGQEPHLILDHLEDLPSSPPLLAAIWHLFNLFHQSDRPILAATRRAPRRLENLDTHLRSRFAWGLLVSLEPPDDPTRERILEHLARQRALRLRPEVIRSILNRAPRDPVSLERLVATLDALSLETGRRIDRRLLSQALEQVKG